MPTSHATMNIKILIYSFPCLCPAHTDRFFVISSSKKKLGVKVSFFIGLSQHTRTDFLSQTKHRTYLVCHDFYWSVIWRTRPDFQSESLCLTMAGEASLLDYVTLIFFRTEVNAHGLIFIADKLSERKVQFFIGPKISLCGLGLSRR